MEQQNLHLSPEQQKLFSRCFPRLLHFILCEVHKMGLSHIMSWEPSGTQFKIHNEDLFITEVAPHFFAKQSKIRSFYRQLNLWGFERGDRKLGDNMWSRENFSREFPEGIMLIKRCAQSSDKKKPTVKQLQQDQKKASPLSEAKSKVVTPVSKASNALTDNEVVRNRHTVMNEAKKIISAFSARLKEINAGVNLALITSLLRQAESSDVSSNKDDSYGNDGKSDSMTRSVSSNASTVSSTLAKNITDHELEEKQLKKIIRKECVCNPPSVMTTVLIPPLKTTALATPRDVDTYMSFLEDNDDNLSFSDVEDDDCHFKQ